MGTNSMTNSETGVVMASDGKTAVCLECNATFTLIGNARKHYQRKHMEQRPMDCPICRKEFPSKPKCDQHVSRDHKITLAELKTSKFMELSEDGLSGLTILTNGK